MLYHGGPDEPDSLSSQRRRPAGSGKHDEFMKVFLRSTQTGRYYQGPSQWTPEQDTALDLKQVAQAVELIFAAHLEDVEILLCYDDPRYDLVLPVPPSPSRGGHAGRPHTRREGRGTGEDKQDTRDKKDPRL